ncbi:MAG TPA: YceI family protein [Lutibacter sp.]|nr:YceI family protein [Lutibacter sp.]
MRITTFILFVLSIFGLFVFASQPKAISTNKSYTVKVDTFVLDTAKSVIHWNCKHYGSIKFKSGFLNTSNEILDGLHVSINMNSVKNTDIENKLLQGTLENVLKSIEFFNTEVYPEARFESHQITKLENNNYYFEGDFVFFENGICSNFKGTVKIENDSIHLNTETIIINRTDWGMYYLSVNNLYPKEEESGFVVSDTIFFDAHITAYRKK